MKTIIVDDEKPARKRLLRLLEGVKKIEVIGECSNGKSAVLAINELSPDLIFLDINLKDLNGFQVLQQIFIQPKPLVIFVSAYDEYALQAFDYEAFDFLLKPFKEERLFKSLGKALAVPKDEVNNNFEKRMNDFFKLYKTEEQESFSLKLPLREGNKTMFLETVKINYILASGSYVEIITNNKKHIFRASLNSLIEKLDPKTFCRIHRSAIINLNFIEEIIHSNYSEIDVRMKDNKLIRISKSQKKEFLRKIGLNK